MTDPEMVDLDRRPPRRVRIRIGDTPADDEYADVSDPIAADHWSADRWGPLR